MRLKITATVILYNPTKEIFFNINSYINAIDLLIVVDNSENKNDSIIDELLAKYENILYIFNNENLGIATALNIACDKAIELKYKWILTMDQDSSFLDINNYLKCFKKLSNERKDIGIIAPNHSKHNENTTQDCSVIEKEIIITSGNILNLNIFNSIGRFDDDLFIDMVDYDISNKILLSDYKIYMFENIYMIHNIGEVFKRKNIITQKIKEKIEHDPQRVYYMTRNRLLLSKKYSKSLYKEYNIFKTLNILYIHDITKILLYEDQKIKKLYAKTIALYHFIINKSGKYIL